MPRSPGTDYATWSAGIFPASIAGNGSASRPYASRTCSRSSSRIRSVTPRAFHRVKYQYIVCQGGKSTGNCRHEQPVRTRQTNGSGPSSCRTTRPARGRLPAVTQAPTYSDSPPGYQPDNASGAATPLRGCGLREHLSRSARSSCAGARFKLSHLKTLNKTLTQRDRARVVTWPCVRAQNQSQSRCVHFWDVLLDSLRREIR
jgi:hypothetical protein